MTSNTRFLILPWVEVPHLASHVLGLIARRIREDWQAKYGHPVHALETFVDRSRFKGTCYRAANWMRLGATQGRTIFLDDSFCFHFLDLLGEMTERFGVEVHAYVLMTNHFI